MSNSDHLDKDILRCKADILRSKGVVPPFKPKKQDAPGSVKTQVGKDTNIAEAREVRNFKNTDEKLKQQGSLSGQELSALLKDKQQDRAGIPEFNLAEQIMAQQRKITAVRRKAPGQKSSGDETKSQEQDSEINDSTQQTMLPQRQQIITEIVARDIERLCNYSELEILR